MKSAENLHQQVIWSLLYTYTAHYEQDCINYSSMSKFSVLQNAWELSKNNYHNTKHTAFNFITNNH